MAQLLADENFPAPVTELRRLGHDVRTIAEAGRANQRLSDEGVLALAHGERRAVVTLNRRLFARLHATQPDHSGIVVSTPDADLAALAQRIDAQIRSRPNLAGALVRVIRPRS